MTTGISQAKRPFKDMKIALKGAHVWAHYYYSGLNIALHCNNVIMVSSDCSSLVLWQRAVDLELCSVKGPVPFRPYVCACPYEYAVSYGTLSTWYDIVIAVDSEVLLATNLLKPT